MDLNGCSNLVELPSSIGNFINLLNMYLSSCSSLVELPSSIGNIINLERMDHSGCSSLVELTSSIGNLRNLLKLRLDGCSKLEALPININMESLDELDLTDCSLVKSFPEISTNITLLKLAGTAIEEIPSSVSTLSRFHELHISYRENLWEVSHAFDYITGLHVSDKRIQEIAPWIKDLSRLDTLVIKGCTKLVSLPHLPHSLKILDAENCESLETLDCSFHNNELNFLNFPNCFKLNQEARDIIITKASNCEVAILPGEKVPPQFTYRAIGSSLSIKLSGIEKPFQACLMLVKEGDFEVVYADWNLWGLDYSITEKQNGVTVTCSSENMDLSTRLKKHLFIFQCEEKKLPRLSSLSSELVFEFQVNVEIFEIEECGIRILPKAL